MLEMTRDEYENAAAKNRGLIQNTPNAIRMLWELQKKLPTEYYDDVEDILTEIETTMCTMSDTAELTDKIDKIKDLLDELEDEVDEINK